MFTFYDPPINIHESLINSHQPGDTYFSIFWQKKKSLLRVHNHACILFCTFTCEEHIPVEYVCFALSLKYNWCIIKNTSIYIYTHTQTNNVRPHLKTKKHQLSSQDYKYKQKEKWERIWLAPKIQTLSNLPLALFWGVSTLSQKKIILMKTVFETKAISHAG